MWSSITPIVAIGLMLAVPAAYDAAVAVAGERTISNVYRDLGHNWSSVLIYAVSVLPGHWWVNFERKRGSASGH